MPNDNTVDILRRFGFQDSVSRALGMDALKYDLLGFTLEALPCMGKSFRPVMLFTSVAATRLTVAYIEFELPRRIPSAEQCAALLAYYLRNETRDDTAWWFLWGRTLEDHLPWRIEQAKEAARPRCRVERDWMKLAIREMQAELPLLPFDEPSSSVSPHLR